MVNRVSNDQLDVLLNFLAEHPSLARGVGHGPRSKEKVEKQWNDLARKLNSFGSGSSKTGDRWKKYWADLKHKSKTRLAKWRMDAQSTGGGLEDKSDIDKKILAIVGVQAMYRDSQHRIPVVNIQPEVQVTATVQPDNFIEVSEEVVISDASESPEPVADSVEAEIQQAPEPQQTGLESPVSQPQPARSRRRRPRLNKTSLNSNISTSLKQWVTELERNKVQAEKKMATACLMIAEAVNKIADASLMNAETNRMNAETNRINAETNRKQLETMKAIMDVVGQPSQPSSARLRAEDSSQSENEMTVFCPKRNMAEIQTLNEKEGRNANNRQEPPEQRCRARKRPRQTNSSSEADSSDDNDDDNEQSSDCHDEEPEIVVGPAAVKTEPNDIMVNKEHDHDDPISVDVKTERMDSDEVDKQQTQDESSTTATASNVRLTEKGKEYVRRNRNESGANRNIHEGFS